MPIYPSPMSDSNYNAALAKQTASNRAFFADNSAASEMAGTTGGATEDTGPPNASVGKPTEITSPEEAISGEQSTDMQRQVQGFLGTRPLAEGEKPEGVMQRVAQVASIFTGGTVVGGEEKALAGGAAAGAEAEVPAAARTVEDLHAEISPMLAGKAEGMTARALTDNDQAHLTRMMGAPLGDSVPAAGQSLIMQNLDQKGKDIQDGLQRIVEGKPSPGQFHGAYEALPNEADLTGARSAKAPSRAPFGEGFYTTENANQAKATARQGQSAKPAVYRVTPNEGTQMLDLDQKPTPELAKKMDDITDKLELGRFFDEHKSGSMQKWFGWLDRTGNANDYTADELTGVKNTFKEEATKLGASGYSWKDARSGAQQMHFEPGQSATAKLEMEGSQMTPAAREAQYDREIRPLVQDFATVPALTKTAAGEGGQAMNPDNFKQVLAEQHAKLGETLDAMSKPDKELLTRNILSQPKGRNVAELLSKFAQDHETLGLTPEEGAAAPAAPAAKPAAGALPPKVTPNSKLGDWMLRYATQASLSSPTLPFRKLATDALSLKTKPLVYGLATQIGKMTGWEAPPTGTMAAAAEAAHGTAHTMWHYFRTAMREGQEGGFSAEHGSYSAAFSNDAFAERSQIGKASNYLSYLNPRRYIMAMGEGAKAAGYNMERGAVAHMMGYERAVAKLGKPTTEQDLANVMLETKNIRTQLLAGTGSEGDLKELESRALSNAEQDVFMGGAKSQLSRNIEGILNYPIGGIPLLRLSNLFYRTPAALFKASRDFSPVGMAYGAYQHDSAMTAKGAMGSIAAGIAMGLHASGHMTGGGPVSPAQRANWIAAGWRPYTINIDGQHFSYEHTPLIGETLMAVNNIGDIYASEPGNEDIQDKLGMIAAGVMSRALEHAPMMDLVDALATFSTNLYHGQAVSSSAADSIADLLVPKIVKSVTQVIDPVKREADRKAPVLPHVGMNPADSQFVQDLMERTPYTSTKVSQVRGHWGQEMYLPGGYSSAEAPGMGYSLIRQMTPWEGGNDDTDRTVAVNREVEKLGVTITPPTRAATKDAAPLSDQDYDKVQVYAGMHKLNLMHDTMQTPAYKQLANGEQKQVLRSLNVSANQLGWNDFTRLHQQQQIKSLSDAAQKHLTEMHGSIDEGPAEE